MLQGKAPSKLSLKRFYRPEDISIEHAYQAGLNEVFSSEEKQDVDLDDLEGQCSAVNQADASGECWLSHDL